MTPRDFPVISRANIQVASLPTVLIGSALAAGKPSEFRDAGVIVYAVLLIKS